MNVVLSSGVLMSPKKGKMFNDHTLASLIRDLILEYLSFEQNFEEKKENFDSEFTTSYLQGQYAVLGSGHRVDHHSTNYYLLRSEA